jgi:hypothetical protein
MKKLVTCFLFCATAVSSFAQRINQTNIEAIVTYLASDELNGRGTGTDDERKAAKYIANKFRMMGLKPMGNNEKVFGHVLDKPYYYDFTKRMNKNIHAEDDSSSEGELRIGRNVVGFIDNKKAYTVVIGAHYDHLGLGMDHNSLMANPEGSIHNGADDNASGVAGLLELANVLTSNGVVENYNFLFIAFSGEELGLIGSKRWCENPTLPIDKINYMLNMDMIGRLNTETNKLVISGIGTSANFERTLDRVNTGFSLKKDSSGVGPSDHTSFYLKNIPVMHFFTGQHSDYHKPTDDAYKVNYSGIVQVLEYMVNIIYDLDRQPKQTFLKTRNNDEQEKIALKVTMGIMPDYTFDGQGLRIDDVTHGKPAHNAGLEAKDIILEINHNPITEIQGYMKELNKLNKGQRVEVKIQRGEEVLTKEVQF